MTRLELIMKNLHSRSFEQPRPVRPFEMTDAIVSFSKDAERIALLESLIASMEASTPPTAPSTLPPPTPRPTPILLPDPQVWESKPKMRANPRPLPPLLPPHLRFRHALWEIPPNPSELPMPGVVSSSQPYVLPSLTTFLAFPPLHTLPYAVVSFRLPSPSETVFPPTTGVLNGAGPTRPATNDTKTTTQPHDGANATTAGNQNVSF